MKMMKATLSAGCHAIERYTARIVLAVFVVELNVETKKARGTMEMPKRKKEMKLTAKFVFVKNAVTVSGCATLAALNAHQTGRRRPTQT